MADQKRQWDLPEEILTDEYKCVLLRIPDKPEYVKAFYDAYDSLCRWLSWERRGNTSARDAANLFRRYRPVWMDCEIADSIDEETGDMAINLYVTTNCNCTGSCGCSDFPAPTTTETVPVPLDPINPLGDSVPTWDDVNEVPPPGYDDWQSFIDDRCRAANYMVDAWLEMVKNADVAERQLSAGGAILEVAAVVIALLPGPIADWLGGVVIIKWVTQVAGIILEAADDLEELNDWLQFSADTITENRQELTCGLFQMTTVDWFTQFFTTFFGGYVDPAMRAAGADTRFVDWTRRLVSPLATWLAERAVNGIANMSIPDDYVPVTDCSLCEGFTPTFFRATGANDNVVKLPYTWKYGGDFLRVISDVTVNQDGEERADWLQQDPVQNTIEQYNTFINAWAIRLNSRTSATSGRLQGQLTSNSDIASFIINTCYANVGGFSKWYVRIALDGVVILGDEIMRSTLGGSPTEKSINLPQVYPAGTVFDVQITSSPGWDEIMGDAFFSSAVQVYE